MKEREEENLVTPGEVLGKASEFKPGNGAYVSSQDKTVYASVTGFRSLTPAPVDSVDPVINSKKPRSDSSLFCIYISFFFCEFICGMFLCCY